VFDALCAVQYSKDFAVKQITPPIAAGIVVAALLIVGIVVFMMNKSTPAPRPVPAEEKQFRGMSPDDQVRARIQQMQQGRPGGQ
jgi:hypothetical protein